MWKDAALITVSFVLCSQMGLISAFGKLIHYEFKIFSCVKCGTFWISLAWHLVHRRSLLDVVAVSFLSSYVSLWLALAYDGLAVLYNKAYEKVQNQAESEDTDQDEPGSGSDEVS